MLTTCLPLSDNLLVCLKRAAFTEGYLCETKACITYPKPVHTVLEQWISATMNCPRTGC
jgi:hypothetical protein